MKILKKHSGLYLDYYELTMAQGYFYAGKKDENSNFEYFFRKNPFNGGYVVFAGLEELLRSIEYFRYSPKDIAYLKNLGFKKEFLDYLSGFRFRGKIYSVKEGEIIFPNEPVVMVEGNLIEAQLIETILLNYLNFQSLIATKACRIHYASKGNFFADFGLRRAQAWGGIQASRATIIGGAFSTSNLFAGKNYDIPVSGTQAHSWIQSFDDELMAFRAYAKVHPDHTILLVDSYNTLKSGVPNAIIVAKELEKGGYQLKAIRLDSGDLAYLSKKARQMLDLAGLKYVKIFASNQLNEYVIKSLQEQEACIDGYGVGTELVTGQDDGALGGVYKLVHRNGKACLKISENVEKITMPGTKKLYRYYNKDGKFFRDGVLLTRQANVDTIYHPLHAYKYTNVEGLKYEVLTAKVMENGKMLISSNTPMEINAYLKERFALLADEHKRFISPHIYKVGYAKEIINMRDEMVRELQKKFR